MIGDFKRNEKMFEQETIGRGMTMQSKKKMDPVDVDDVGGVFVYEYIQDLQRDDSQ